MEFQYGRRESYYSGEVEEEHVQTSSPTNPSLPPSSSSSSNQLVSQPTVEDPATALSTTTVLEREHMFEKVVTPSDVGKLNRLVIPKQHAERYFPLDTSSNEKRGLLLNFEEERSGKPWCFRYSYWDSSQSYVMTKGWSRFVKDKHLDAGDTVLFSRSPCGRLFIDWRRRPLPPEPPFLMRSMLPPWGWASSALIPSPHYAAPSSALYFRSIGPTMDGILESIPVGIPRATTLTTMSAVEPKRVRLFGVNLDQFCSEPKLVPAPSPLQWRLSTASSPELQLLPEPMVGMDLDSQFIEKEEEDS